MTRGPATELVTGERVRIGGGAPLVIVAGPDVIESEALAVDVAGHLKESLADLPVSLVFKASYDKANRSSPRSYRGPGFAEGMRILTLVSERFGIPVTSDVHSPEEAIRAGAVLDIIQIPAFLCRQNDLLRAAAETGRIVNIKKGQFLSPEEVALRVEAASPARGPRRVIVTERGTSFGYRYLVNDMKAIPWIRGSGTPLIFDATHSVQLPGAMGDRSGGARDLIPHIARGAAGVGCDGFFFETHPDPDRALCDGPSSLPLHQIRALVEDLVAIDRIARRQG